MAGGAHPVRERRRGGRSGQIVGINVTPMVDVALVLLVILMVSSTYIVAQALKVELPRTHTSDGTPEAPVTLTLLRDGSVRFADAPIDEREVPARLAAALKAKPGLALVISADREVQHGRVVHFIDVAREAGIHKFAINVEKGE